LPIFINLIERGEFLHSGEFQYFRIPEHLWDSGLKNLKEAGINTISTYIPWIWHEYEENKFDFTGETHPQRDLEYFLKLVRAYGFNFIARPGPYIYAEYQGFGIPEWLREKHPEILIKTADGKMAQEVSLLHPVFQYYAQRWLNEVLEFLISKREEGLKLLAVQLDNETGLPQYNTIRVFSDFNEHTVTLFRLWLKKRYSLDELNSFLNSKYSDFSEIYPPTFKDSFKFKNLWYEFVEEYIINYLEALKRIYDGKLKSQIDYFLNVPFTPMWPDSHPKKSAVSIVGCDIYTKLTPFKVVDDLPFTASFTANYFLSLNRKDYFIAPEVQAGWFDPISYVPFAHTFFLGATLYLFNARLISWYIAHDCIEIDETPWIWNSFLDINGKPTRRYSVIKRIKELVESIDYVINKSTLLRDDIGIVTYSIYGRKFFEATFNRKFKHAVAPALLLMSAHGLYGLLSDNSFMPKVIILEKSTIEELSKFKVLFFPSLGFIDYENCKKLIKYVENGGRLIIYGYPITTIIDNDKHECDLIKVTCKKLKISAPLTTLLKIGVAQLKYKWRRRQIKHKQSLHTIDSYAILVELLKELPSLSYSLKFNDIHFKGELLLALVENKEKSFIHDKNNNPISTIVEIGNGKIYFIGSVLGALYNTFHYFNNSPILNNQRTFISRFMSSLGVRPTIKYPPGIEIIARKTMTEGIVIGIINRRLSGNAIIDLTKIIPDDKFRFRILFNYKDTQVKSLEKALEINFIGNDFIVCMFEQV